MRATGIVRRIDELGRVVIPKEIRRSLCIKEGDPIEIFVDLDSKMVCLQKYNYDVDSAVEELRTRILDINDNLRADDTKRKDYIDLYDLVGAIGKKLKQLDE